MIGFIISVIGLSLVITLVSINQTLRMVRDELTYISMALNNKL
jgi:hypothetical protein